jgi:hypothetical protein
MLVPSSDMVRWRRASLGDRGAQQHRHIAAGWVRALQADWIASGERCILFVAVQRARFVLGNAAAFLR